MSVLPNGFAFLDDAIDPKFSTSLQQRIDHALSVVNKIHWDGSVRPRVVGFDDGSDPLTYGYLDPTDKKLGMHPNGPHPESTFVHELGHVLDLYGIGRGKIKSKAGHQFTAWRAAVRSTDGYKNLKSLSANAEMRIVRGGKWIARPKTKVFQDHVTYLLYWWELWARAYYQWIVFKSGDQLLKTQFDSMRAKDYEITFGSQWMEDDFIPVAGAMDDLIQALKYTGVH